MSGSFSLIGRIRSFRYALAGIRTLLATQQNARVHAAATVAVVTAGFLFGVTAAEWCCLVLAIVAVWSAEAMNTAIEFLADVASPDFHPLVKKAKDVAATGVLVAAVGAVVVGLLVFGSYAVEWR